MAVNQMQEALQEAAAGTASLAGKKAVLVKFTFARSDLIPNGVRNTWRLSDEQMDKQHADRIKDLGHPELAEEGRHRKERVDTGEPVINNSPLFAQVANIRRGLTNNGFFLASVHSFQKRGTDKFVLVLSFEPSKQPGEIPKDVVQGLRELANLGWQYVTVWDNFHEETITINLGGRIPTNKPKYAIVVRDHAVTAIPVERPVEENEE